jgi:MFS family permease
MSYDEDFDGDSMFAGEERSPLTRLAAPGTIKYAAPYIYRNFLIMAVSVSAGHGVMTTCLAYAAAELGSSLGGVSSGILYILYAIVTLLLAKPFVTMTGPKLSLVAALIALCVYGVGFVLGIVFLLISTDMAWLAACSTATVGGFGVGVMWTAQGRMFAQNSKLYSEAARLPVERCNAMLGAVFASVFLGTEMVLKVVATVVYLIFPSLGQYVIFTAYAALALVACMMAMSVDELNDEGTGVFNYKTISKEAGAVAKMTWLDKRLALIAPFQIAFGFLMAFLNLYIFGEVISTDEDWGTVYIGLSSALVVLVGAALATPASWAANTVGNEAIILTGAACMCLGGGLLYLFSNSSLAAVTTLIPYLIVVGVGRLSWVSEVIALKSIRMSCH